MNSLFLRGTFHYFFITSEISRIDIFRSIFGVRFGAKGLNFGLLHNLLTIGAFFGDGWKKILHRPEFGTKIRQKNGNFGVELLLILSKTFFGSFSSLYMLGLMPTQRYKRV